MSDNQKSQYLVPGAILAAGVVIAIAVVLTNGGLSLGGTKDTTGDTAGVTSPTEIAKAIGLKAKDFQKCMDEKRHTADVTADSQDAAKAGGTGTPFSVVINPEGTKYPIFGAFPIDQVKPIIDGALVNDQAILKTLETQFERAVGEVVPVSADDHILGDANAPIKMVLFSDMQCPFCKTFHATAKQVVTDYKGQVALIYRHLPLVQIHANAQALAEGSECAAELGGNDAFWKYLDKAFGA